MVYFFKLIPVSVIFFREHMMIGCVETNLLFTFIYVNLCNIEEIIESGFRNTVVGVRWMEATSAKLKI